MMYEPIIVKRVLFDFGRRYGLWSDSKKSAHSYYLCC